MGIDPGSAGFLTDVGMCYAIDDHTLHLWKSANPDKTKQALPVYTSKVIAVKSVKDPGTKQQILIVITKEEIHLYTLKHQGDLTFQVAPMQPPVSTDRTPYSLIYQTPSDKKVYIGGEHGKISEVQFKNGGKDSKSRALMVMKYIKSKVIGEGNKVRKVDKAIAS